VAQTTIERLPNTAAETVPRDADERTSTGIHVAPAFVEVRARIVPAVSPTQATVIREPLTPIEGTPVRPSADERDVVPTVSVRHVVPRSRLIAIRIDPVAESVHTTYTELPATATSGKSTRPVVDVIRWIVPQPVLSPFEWFTRTYKVRGAVWL
jgi:hypothetical protein